MTTATRKTKTTKTSAFADAYEAEGRTIAQGDTPSWQPQEGDRVAGSTIEGNPDQGIITQRGAKYAILDNQSRRALTIASLTLLQPQAIPVDLLPLVGLSWSEQVDQVFGDRGISNLANYSGSKPDLTHFESWRGWLIRFNGGTEVHLCKAGQQSCSWFFALSKQPQLKGNGDLAKFCHQAIDEVEETLACLSEARIAVVEAGMGDQEPSIGKKTGNYFFGDNPIQIDQETFDRLEQTYSGDRLEEHKIKGTFHWEEREFVCTGVHHAGSHHHADSLEAVEIVALDHWDRKTYNYDGLRGKDTFSYAGLVVERKQRRGTFSFVLTDRELHFAVVVAGDEAAAPMSSLGALLPTVEATIITNAQTAAADSTNRLKALAAEIEAIYAEAEEAETTMLNAGRAAFTRSLALGEKLLAAKAEAEIGGYGKWLPWLEARGIPERKAQRAIRLYSHRQLLTNSDAVTELTLTEALERISKKALKPESPEPPQTENAPLAAKLTAPETTTPDRALSAIAPQTAALEGENWASVVDVYEYIEMAPVPAWFDLGDGVIAGMAIAANGRGYFRLNWGRGKQSDVPGDRVHWAAPELVEFEPVPAFDTQNLERPVQPNGIVEERPACSLWEPEEVANVARIQLQGLLKHLEPAELVKAAIVHSGVSLPDVVRVVIEMANKDDFEQILEVLDRGLQT